MFPRLTQPWYAFRFDWAELLVLTNYQLLYNKFGFKAEEFVVGFYDDYLDRQTRLCKNALRLRYRR